MVNDRLTQKKVFVTGGNGFLGSWLVKRLLDYNAEITCLMRDDLPRSIFSREKLDKRVRIVPGELEDAELLKKTIKEGSFSAVFHLAAQTIVTTANSDPVPTFRSNILGSWNLLEACRGDSNIKAIIIASSDKAYGVSANLPYLESHPLQGSHPYDVSKSCVDLIAQTYYKSFALPIGIVRSGNIVGGGDLNQNRIVPETINALMRGERPLIRSNGKLKRDFVYVEDVVDAYIKIAESVLNNHFVGRPWNVSNGRPVEVRDVVNELRLIMKREDMVPDIRNEAVNEIPDQYLDSSNIRAKLGWAPKHDLGAALKKTVDWHLKNSTR